MGYRRGICRKCFQNANTDFRKEGIDAVVIAVAEDNVFEAAFRLLDGFPRVWIGSFSAEKWGASCKIRSVSRPGFFVTQRRICISDQVEHGIDWKDSTVNKRF